MKLNELSWNVSEEQYRDLNCLSYSLVSKYEREGFDCIADLFNTKEDTPSLRFGSLVDCLFTNKDAFDDIYALEDCILPSDAVKKIMDTLYSNYPGSYFDELPTEIVLSNATGYYDNLKDETKYKKLKEAGKDYYDMLVKNEGKIIINIDEYTKAVECINSLKNHRVISEILENKYNTELFYQLKFTEHINEIGVKCMFDMLYVNHNDKTIQPIDLKTTSKPTYKFNESFMYWRYYRQAELYTMILQKNIRGTEFEDYKILPFLFFVVNSNTADTLVFQFKLVPEFYTKNKIRPITEVLEEMYNLIVSEAKLPNNYSADGICNLNELINTKEDDN